MALLMRLLNERENVMDTKRMSAVQRFVASHPLDLMDPDYPDSYAGTEPVGDWNYSEKRDKQWNRVVQLCQCSPGKYISFPLRSPDKPDALKRITRHKADYLESYYKEHGLKILLQEKYILVRVDYAAT